MAQINLLKQKKSGFSDWNAVLKIFARILLVVFAILAVYYGWLIYSERKADKQIAELQTAIDQAKTAAVSNKDRTEVLARQQQLQSLDKLIGSHTYWSGLLPALAKVTLNKTVYSSFKASSEGLLTLSATLPSLEDLDKYLQVFDLPEYYANFSNIKIGAFHEVPQGDTTVVKVEVTMSFNPALLQYQGASKNK